MLRSLSLLLLSATLLIFAFPKTTLWYLAWIGLVPLMFAVDGKTQKQAFTLGYLCGLIFFIGTIYWFVFVTKVGASLLILYFSVYFAIFAWSYNYFKALNPILKIIILPSVWVVLELARAHIFSGFDWVSLGQSQYQNIHLIQIADITGMYGVSFIVVMGNVVLKTVIDQLTVARKKFKTDCIAFFLFILILTLGYGQLQLLQNFENRGQLKVALIQGNIDLKTRWDEESWIPIIDKYVHLSSQVVASLPDLVIWPETAFPGFLWEDETFLEPVKRLVKQNYTNLLFGTVLHYGSDYHNSAVLLSHKEENPQEYFKYHLVPYGEYIPYRNIFPFLSEIIPVDDFTPGEDYTVFHLREDRDYLFSTLICFEDTVARLVRKFVQNGAQLLVNISNDAWFRDTPEPYMHLQSAVFRSVENRRSMVRASNVGLSCYINPKGVVVDCVKDAQGKPTYVEGTRTLDVGLSNTMTLYTQWGDVFAYLCILIVLCGFGYKIFAFSKD